MNKSKTRSLGLGLLHMSFIFFLLFLFVYPAKKFPLPPPHPFLYLQAPIVVHWSREGVRISGSDKKSSKSPNDKYLGFASFFFLFFTFLFPSLFSISVVPFPLSVFLRKFSQCLNRFLSAAQEEPSGKKDPKYLDP